MAMKMSIKLVLTSGVFLSLCIVAIQPVAAVSPSGVAMTSAVLAAVQAAQNQNTVPSNLVRSLTQPKIAGPSGYFGCGSVKNPAHADLFGDCFYGSKTGDKLMVIYGDSHASMWADTLAVIAKRSGWKLKVFGFGGCPVIDLSFYSYQTNAPNPRCTLFHKTAVSAIRALHPQLIFVTSFSNQEIGPSVYPSNSQWQSGLEATLKSLQTGSAQLVVIGNIPSWSTNYATCLAAHLSSVQSGCAVPISEGVSKNNVAEAAAASALNIPYVDTVPWICAAKCEPVIGKILVYYNEYHISDPYAQYLTGALQAAVSPYLRAP